MEMKREQYFFIVQGPTQKFKKAILDFFLFHHYPDSSKKVLRWNEYQKINCCSPYFAAWLSQGHILWKYIESWEVWIHTKTQETERASQKGWVSILKTFLHLVQDIHRVMLDCWCILIVVYVSSSLTFAQTA